MSAQDRRAADAVRSNRRYANAAAVLPKTTLDQTHAAALDWILGETEESRAALVRRLILDEAQRMGMPENSCGGRSS